MTQMVMVNGDMNLLQKMHPGQKMRVLPVHKWKTGHLKQANNIIINNIITNFD